MRHRRSYAALQLAAVAAVSVLVGHWAAYVLAVPDAGLRDTILLDTGHAYWLLGVKLALLLGVVSVAAGGFDALRRGLARSSGADGWRPTQALLALALIQVGSFTALEISERVVAGEPLTELWHHGIFPLGVVAQLVLAPAGAALLWWLGKTFERVARVTVVTRVARPGQRVVFLLPRLAAIAPVRDCWGAVVARGPPA
jgi:hypothetical protein